MIPVGMQPPKVTSPGVIWIIHLANILGVPIYGVLTYTLPPRPVEGHNLLPFPVSAVFGCSVTISIIQAIAAYKLVDRIFAPALAEKIDATKYLGITQTRLIVADAFLEAIAFYGLLGHMIFGFERWQSFALMLFSLILLSMQAYRLTGWIEEYNTRKRRDG
jgi:hypothetical protein